MKKISLDYEEKGILKYLRRNEEGITLEEIGDYLKEQEYGDFTKKNLREKMDHLIDVAYVRSKTVGEGKNRKEKFSLSNYVVGGTRKKMDLQGRGILSDVSKLVKKLFSWFFLLMGLGLFAYENPNVTGAVIGSSNTNFILGGLFILIALGLFFIKPIKK